MSTERPQIRSLVERIVQFGRELRSHGIPVAVDQIAAALSSVSVPGGVFPENGWAPDDQAEILIVRTDFKEVLATCLLGSALHRVRFEKIFKAFWSETETLLLSESKSPSESSRERELSSRQAGDAAAPPATEISTTGLRQESDDKPDNLPNSTSGAGENSALGAIDFCLMSDDERSASAVLLQSLVSKLRTSPSRRFSAASQQGQPDFRAMLLAMGRRGADAIEPRWRNRKRHPLSITVVVDISGSMVAYSRMLLLFAYLLCRSRGVSRDIFVFGTSLTRITSICKLPLWQALEKIESLITDAAGGTRIGEALRDLNNYLYLRGGSSNLSVVFVTDGLERGDIHVLKKEIKKLRSNCRQLLWVNQLAKFEGFSPRTLAMSEIALYADVIIPGNNLDSVKDIIEAVAS